MQILLQHIFLQALLKKFRSTEIELQIKLLLYGCIESSDEATFVVIKNRASCIGNLGRLQDTQPFQKSQWGKTLQPSDINEIIASQPIGKQFLVIATRPISVYKQASAGHFSKLLRTIFIFSNLCGDW